MKLFAVRICAQGRNHARFLDALRAADVNVTDFTRTSPDEFSFCVQKKDLHKTFAILREMCYTYSTTGVTYGATVVKGLCKRAGLLCGLLVFSVLLSLSRGFVWRIRISGNDAVPDKVIENTLSQHNISVGKRLSGTLAAAVRGIDGIRLASVYVKGTTVFVDVHESDPISPPLSYSDTDIVSAYDATVTRIVTREGTALVEPGQHVFAGTPLIGAYRRAQEEGAEPIPSKASGLVYGKVAFTKTVNVAAEWIEYVPQSVKSYTRLELFGLSIGKKPPVGAGYEVTESRSTCNVFLPITVCHTRVTQMRKQKRTATIEELAASAEQSVVSSFIHEKIPGGFTVRRTVRELGGGVYAVHVFIEAETIIGGV